MSGSENDEMIQMLVFTFSVVLIAAMILLLWMQFAFLSFGGDTESQPVSATSQHLTR